MIKFSSSNSNENKDSNTGTCVKFEVGANLMHLSHKANINESANVYSAEVHLGLFLVLLEVIFG